MACRAVLKGRRSRLAGLTGGVCRRNRLYAVRRAAAALVELARWLAQRNALELQSFARALG